MTDNPRKYEFSYIPGFFTDYMELGKRDPNKRVLTQPRLGILPQSYDTGSSGDEILSQWKQLERHLEYLNQKNSGGESYKVLYVIRHGYSVHNLVRSKVGKYEWNSNLALKEGGSVEGLGSLSWVDAELMKDGEAVAQTLGETWANWVKNDGIPLPSKLYTSPLRRCLDTTKLVYSAVLEGNGKTFQPIIKESLRERLTQHTCDKRHTRTWIENNYAKHGYQIEVGFEEENTLWDAAVSKEMDNPDLHVARTRKLLEELWDSSEGDLFISLTTHSYTLDTLFEVVGMGRDAFRLGEGAMIAVLVKRAPAVEKKGKESGPK
ncbi:histidine phosphatase superfamily [Pseudomassariella vexata]|uniref:Histidine phosphatase superfamily n=1 Tax=Pseudomassariella vexata TaxID=1141098 RepID=A0A1Y2DT08_9PEZI|nr:histidine phosphatase superfamily [Pseudomassariella vexata]ORY62387.1 histidine phosphatase superfamily [Pseudomassariella vexata]